MYYLCSREKDNGFFPASHPLFIGLPTGAGCGAPPVLAEKSVRTGIKNLYLNFGYREAGAFVKKSRPRVWIYGHFIRNYGLKGRFYYFCVKNTRNNLENKNYGANFASKLRNHPFPTTS